MAYIEIIILSAVALFSLYKWSVSNYHILRDRGIPHHKPTALIGNFNMNVLLGKSSFMKFIIDNYSDFKSRKIYGIYSMRDVNIYIPDIDLIKKIAIKDFDTFPNHNSVGGGEEGGNTFLSKSLIVLKDNKWREMRNSLSPSFTGSKMRLMFQLVNECVVQAVNYSANECKISKIFVAGFETVSACLCFTAHELLENSVIQDKLYEEILETHRSLEGKPLNYDVLMKLKYLDMVISESLRKWPPVLLTDRICSMDYALKDDDGSLIAEFKKDDNIFVPIIGIHRDPTYYPNPDKFDPERFSDENKNKIKPMSYLPFGLGPRMCIGNRLALMEVKALIYHLILNFEIHRSEKTCRNLMNSIAGFTLIPKEGFWMKFVPRNSGDSTS